MKLSFAFLAFLLFASCSNNSSPGSNNNNSNGTGTYYGANYLPMADNTTLIGHVSGTITYPDANGNITRTDQVDQDYNAAIGFIETRDGRSVHPIYSFDANGQKSNNGNPVGYGGSLDSEVFAMNRFANSAAATILPKIITVGQTWTPAPEALPIQCQATLVQHLAQYTNKNGTTYNDVIQVLATYLDSTSHDNYYDTLDYDSSMTKHSANADLYFANGIGLVEADVHNYEYLSYEHYYYKGPYYNYYDSKIASGTVWLKN